MKIQINNGKTLSYMKVKYMILFWAWCNHETLHDSIGNWTGKQILNISLKQRIKSVFDLL